MTLYKVKRIGVMIEKRIEEESRQINYMEHGRNTKWKVRRGINM